MQIFIERLQRLSAHRPEDPFLSDHESTWTYRMVNEATLRLSTHISRLTDPQRPCIISGPPIVAAISTLACLRLGKPFIVVSPDVPNQLLNYYIKDSGADILARPGDNSVKGDRPSAPDKGLTQVELISIPLPLSTWVTCAPSHEVACLIYTSGSTGTPKAVVCTYAAMEFSAKAIQNELRYGEKDVVFTSLPLNFDYGLYQLFLSLMAGSHIYFATAAESGFGLAGSLERTSATIIPMVPHSVEKLAKLVTRGLAPHSVRLITTTGAALDGDTRRALERHWGDRVDLRVMYGLTECKRVAIMPPRESYANLEASGRALPGTDISIRSTTDASELREGVQGEIYVTGPHLMAGYHNQPELTQNKYIMVDGKRWLRTGDLGRLDSGGYLYCDGRNESYFKHKGFRVSASEIIANAKTLGSITSALVIPPKDGFPLTLCYEGNADEGALYNYLAGRLEPHSVPESIRKFTRLPLNNNGKLDPKAAKEQIDHG